ncbi:hypothetical protein UNDKW_1668 [Undibacterium sp. KW1]|nr:hypothetical protein UNDKW_1668 [Undibacterium sp. KW1]
MIPSYIKKRNLAVTIYLTGMCTVIYRSHVLGPAKSDIYSGILALVLYGVLIAACWFYLKAKKRSGAWLILIPLNIVAFIIYALMEDRSNLSDNIPCTACGAANFPVDTHCRLCKTELKHA